MSAATEQIDQVRAKGIRRYAAPVSAVGPDPAPVMGDPYPVVRPQPKPSIVLQWASELPEDEPGLAEIVQGVLTAGGMSCMFGESNSGKSYLATHLALSISRGVPWLGRQTERGAVLYVAGEGAASIRRRVRAYEKHFGVKAGPFGLIPHALSLLDGSADVEALLPLIEDAAATVGEPVHLIVVDTLARAMAGADENAGQDMGRLVRAGDRIRERTGAHVLFIHHSGKDSAKGARGHSSLRAALDTELECTAEPSSGLHTLTVTKQRDLDGNGQRLSGRFLPVHLGESRWGDPITACAVESAEAPAPKAKPARLGELEREILALLAGAGKTLRIVEIAEKLEKGRTSVSNAAGRLHDKGLVEYSSGLVHLIGK